MMLANSAVGTKRCERGGFSPELNTQVRLENMPWAGGSPVPEGQFMLAVGFIPR